MIGESVGAVVREAYGRLVEPRVRIARLLPRAGAGPVAALAGVNLVLGVLPVVFAVATSVMLGMVPAAVAAGPGSAEWNSLVAVFAVGAVAFVAQQILTPVQTMLGEAMTRRIDGRIFDDLMDAALRSPGIAPLEDQRLLNELREAVRELEFGFQSPGRACAGLLALIARYTQLTGYVVVVGAVFSWWAAAGLAAAVAMFRYGNRGGLRKYSQVWRDVAPLSRKEAYLRELGAGAAAAQEIRVFGLADWLRERFRETYLGVLRPVWAERRRVYLWPYLWFTLCGLAVAAAVLGGLGATASGELTLTTLALVAQAVLGALRLGEYYPEADVQTQFGMNAYRAVRRFSAGVDAYPDQGAGPARPEAAAHPRAVPEPVREIRFEGVRFHYPGQERMIFDGLDLTIPAGKCTAIVGVNGAGKTTLVKLLARLYEPTAGAIRMDGVDIRTFPLEGWRSRIGVIFQDFTRYEVSAADNIAFGAVAHRDDADGVRAAARAAGIGEVLEGLPRGLDTVLARHVTGGAGLSGGQWQRVALARALFALRHGSPILVLDEPTASLDVRAEATFFDEFAGLTEGATTILISHRFSTVRRADRIVVLENGRVTEEGGHEELLARQGRYAELFRLQADRFAAGQAEVPEVTP